MIFFLVLIVALCNSFSMYSMTDDAYYTKWVEYAGKNNSVTMDHLKGNIPQEVFEIIEYLKDPAHNPGNHGYIFYGPPGTGKSTFAKAIANQVHGICLTISASDFEGSFIGTGPARIENLFKRAYELLLQAPVIIFIDEIEAAGTRSMHSDSSQQYEVRTLDKLISVISEIPAQVPLVVIGATNHEKKLDPALIRQGRCTLVEVPLPDAYARKEIISFYAHKIGHQLDDEYFSYLAQQTDGFNCAALEELVKRAHAHARGPITRKIMRLALLDAQKIQTKNKQIEDEKKEREKMRDQIDRASLAQAKIGWWANALTIAAVLTTGIYKGCSIVKEWATHKQFNHIT